MISTKRHDALAFLQSKKTGVLATTSPLGTPHARLVYYASDDSFRVYFLTLITTQKVKDIQHDSHVAFVVASADIPQTLQIEGTVTDLTGSATDDPVVKHLFENLQSNTLFHAPIERFDSAEVVFYCITPTKITWGDFTEGRGTDHVFTDIPLS